MASQQQKTLILTDNAYALDLAQELEQRYGGIDVFQSPNGPLANVPRLNVIEADASLAEKYALLISIHCKALLPPAVVNSLRCVNVHPGLNPHNRGWFPQVFSIINGLPSGVTIHEIDEEIDHGPIIAQCEYRIESWDTSESAYTKIMGLERELVLEHFEAIRAGTYKAEQAASEGNYNSMKDFEALKLIDLAEQTTFGECIDKLRALSHGDFNNAYFVDAKGNKVFIKLSLKPEPSDTSK